MKLDKKATITLSVCLAAIAGTVYFLFWYDKNKTETTTETAGSTSGAANSTGAAVSVFPLKKGSNNSTVKTLQKKMNEWMNYYYLSITTKPASQQLVVDGIFGSKTLEFVRIIFNADAVTESQYNWLISQSYVSTGTTDKNWLNYLYT